jgi:hypothetical protein
LLQEIPEKNKWQYFLIFTRYGILNNARCLGNIHRMQMIEFVFIEDCHFRRVCAIFIWLVLPLQTPLSQGSGEEGTAQQPACRVLEADVRPLDLQAAICIARYPHRDAAPARRFSHDHANGSSRRISLKKSVFE